MKSKKPSDLFAIPQKKHATDSKTLSKMSTSGLKDVVGEQQKYIGVLVQRIGMVKEHCQKMQDKIDQLEEKNQVVNGQMGRINNQHQELSIKFDMLQNNLETVTTQQQYVLAQEIEFLKQQGVNSDQVRSTEDLLSVYRGQATLSAKIQMQNKKLKETVARLQEQLYNQEEKRGEEGEGEGQESEQKEAEAKEEQHKQEEKTLPTQHSSEVEAPILTQQSDADGITIELQRTQQELIDARQQLEQANEESAKMHSKLEAYSREFGKLKLARQKEREEAEESIAQLNEEIDVLSGELKKAGSVVERKRSQCKELSDKLKEQQQLMKRLQGEIAREKDDRLRCEGMLKDSNETQVSQVLEMKQQTERQLQQAQKAIASLNKKIGQLGQEIKQLRKSNASLIQEKSLIQENVNTCLNVSEQEAKRYKKAEAQASHQISELKEALAGSKAQVEKLTGELTQLQAEVGVLNKRLQARQLEMKTLHSELGGLSKDRQTFDQLMGEKEEDNKIRIRKYESELNQQRIKMQSLTRKINNLQAKAEESRQSMDRMYEQLLSKEKKVGHMEIKLKEYKYLIQVLRKEKQDIENTYESRLNNIQTPPPELPPPSRDSVESEPIKDEENQLLRNQLLSMKEQNLAMIAENEKLRARNSEQEDSIKEQERIIQELGKKRQQLIKELERVGSKGVDQRSSLPPPPASMLSPPTVDPDIRSSKSGEGREKKIAAKAHKGFDILVRMQHQLYKNFMGELGSQLQKVGISGLQAEINTIIKRSSDMRDIFEDYL